MLEPLRVSSDKTHLETSSGEPFFYLADTAWTMAQRLKWDDARHYMSVRKSQGFNVLQIVALDPERDEQMRSPSGQPALIGGDLDHPNENYFSYLDMILDLAEEFEFYVLLLPVWGQLVVGESWGGKTFPKTVTESNAKKYGQWLGDRYKNRSNLIWCLGGDRQPIHGGIDYKTVWREMAEGLALGVTGSTAKWNEESVVWEKVLMTYHTCFEMETKECSTFSYWTDEDKWISFTSLQSGHGLSTENYKTVASEFSRSFTKPVIDIEPAYERMPMNWPELFPLHGDGIIRKRAYWSILAGSCGHTYGHASVWCFISEKERDQVLSASWFEALSHAGAQQIGHVRRVAEILKFQDWIPAQSISDHACLEPCLDSHVQTARSKNGDLIICYLTSGGRVSLQTNVLLNGKIDCYWLNPKTGELTAGSFTEEHSKITVTSPTQGIDEDWLLLATTNSEQIQPLFKASQWGNTESLEKMTMIWAE